MYYSATTNAWYEPVMRGIYEANGTWPADAKLYPAELFVETVTQRHADQDLASDSEGRPVLVLRPALQITAEVLCGQIDRAADAARHKVAGDPLRAEEYKAAAAEAAAFVAANYQGNVPTMVAAWVTPNRTAQQAADDIINEANAYNAALVQLRTTRLQAKEHIRALMSADEVEQAQAVAEHTVAAIEAAVAGIGNNA